LQRSAQRAIEEPLGCSERLAKQEIATRFLILVTTFTILVNARSNITSGVRSVLGKIQAIVSLVASQPYCYRYQRPGALRSALTQCFVPWRHKANEFAWAIHPTAVRFRLAPARKAAATNGLGDD
jgi:hypothetical protein